MSALLRTLQWFRLLFMVQFCLMQAGCLMSDKPTDYATTNITVPSIKSGVYARKSGGFKLIRWLPNGVLEIRDPGIGVARMYPLAQSSYLLMSGESSSNYWFQVSMEGDDVLVRETKISDMDKAKTAASNHGMVLADMLGIPKLTGNIEISQLQGLFNDPLFRASLEPPSSERWSLLCELPPEIPYAVQLQGFSKDPVGNTERLAKQCDADAAYVMAERYENGIGVQKDEKWAWHWYTISGLAGNREAAFELGLIYSQGRYGAEPDGSQAITWYKTAAGHDLVPAMYNIGVIYWNGKLVNKDLAEARKWFQLAAERGDKEAQKMLTKIGW